jgi:signal transduction histidine kinase
VEANHGRLWVESEPGRGATFHLAFPTADEEEEVAMSEVPIKS